MDIAHLPFCVSGRNREGINGSVQVDDDDGLCIFCHVVSAVSQCLTTGTLSWCQRRFTGLCCWPVYSSSEYELHLTADTFLAVQPVCGYHLHTTCAVNTATDSFLAEMGAAPLGKLPLHPEGGRSLLPEGFV